MKDLKLKFNLEDWIKILSFINLKEIDPNQDFSPYYKKEVIARNEEKTIFTEFLLELKKKRTENKGQLFPELIESPYTKNGLVERTIRSLVSTEENRDFYYKLLEVNGEPNYTELVWRMDNQRNRNNVVLDYDIFKNEDSFLHIFQHAIRLCPPREVQEAFKYFAEEYSQLENIDSKNETKEKEDEILSSFHKAMRQTDMFGNAHACSIIYNLWQITDLPARAFIAVTEHVKALEKEIN